MLPTESVGTPSGKPSRRFCTSPIAPLTVALRRNNVSRAHDLCPGRLEATYFSRTLWRYSIPGEGQARWGFAEMQFNVFECARCGERNHQQMPGDTVGVRHGEDEVGCRLEVTSVKSILQWLRTLMPKVA